jgi:hypothetical protein
MRLPSEPPPAMNPPSEAMPAPGPASTEAHPSRREGSSSETPARGVAWAWWAALVGASLLVVWSQRAVPYLPTHDGPEHIVSGTIENRFHEPNTIYAKVLEPASQWAARGFALLFRPLERWLGWREATQWAQVLMQLLGAGAFAGLVVAVEPRRRWLGLLGFAVVPWTLYMGFFPYTLSSAFGLALLAVVVGRRIEGWPARLAVSAALLVHAHLHLLPALLTASLLFVVLVFRREPVERRGEALRVIAMVAPVVVLAPLTLRSVGASAIGFADFSLYPSFDERLLTLPQVTVPGPSWRGLVMLALAAAGIRSALRRARARTARAEEIALACCAAGLLALGVVAPLNIPGWQFFAPRLMFPGMLLGIAMLPIERLAPKRQALAAGGCVALALAQTVATARLHEQLYNGCRDALAGLDLPIRRERTSLALHLEATCGIDSDPMESEVPYLHALEHVGHLYAAQHGGAFSSMFLGAPAIHAFVPKEFQGDEVVPEMPRPGALELRDPMLRGTVLTYYAAHAAFLESFLIFGASPDDKRAVLARGFLPRFEQGGFLMAEFRGCPVALEIAPSGVSGTLQLSHGMWPVRTPVRQEERSARAEERLRVELPRIGCGEVWARPVFFGSDGRARICRGAAPDGTILLRVDERPLTVPCELVASAESPRP